MDKLSYRRHRFPSIVIQQAVWLYFRSALSYRDLEDIQAITIQDHLFATYRAEMDFIRRYIFPGGMLPTGVEFATTVCIRGLGFAAVPAIVRF
jgi:hypothetical protein